MPYRVVDGKRVVWTKHPNGTARKPTKAESLAYWAARQPEVRSIMAKAKEAARGWKKVPSDLNLWPPVKDPKKGTQLVCLVTRVEIGVKIGLGTTTRVKVIEPDGSPWTLKAHKVLVGRLENIPGGMRPMQTALKITYVGREKGNQPQPTEMYEVEYGDRVKDGFIDLFSDVVPADEIF